METTLKVASVAAVALSVVLGLTGCFGSGSGSGLGFAVLDAAADPGDTLPTDLPDDAYDGLDPASSRFVAEHEGDRLFLAKGENATICLVVYPDNRDWVIGCSRGDGSGTVSSRSRSYGVRPDAAPAPEGAKEISPNVFVID